MRSYAFFAYNFWYNWDRGMGQAPMCLSCQDASYDVDHDLLRSFRDLDLRSTFKVDLSRSNDIPFHSSRRGEHDGTIVIALTCSCQKLFAKNDLPSNIIFELWWPLEPKPLTWGQIWWHIAERPFQDLQITFITFLCNPNSSVAKWHFPVECMDLGKMTFDDL